MDSKVLVQEKYTKFRNYSLLIAVQRYNIEEESSLYKASSLTKVTSVKSSLGIITHQGHISQVSRRYPKEDLTDVTLVSEDAL